MSRVTHTWVLASSLLSAFGGVLLCGGCEVQPDIVARAQDAALGLDEDDSGSVDLCEIGAPMDLPESCEVPVPWPFNDLDPERVNVTVFQGTEIQEYGGGLLSSADCAHVIHAWYWVDPPEFTQIGFCPQTCALIRQWGELAFEFGCNTRPPSLMLPRPPRR